MAAGRRIQGPGCLLKVSGGKKKVRKIAGEAQAIRVAQTIDEI